jgi:hypothetical protein
MRGGSPEHNRTGHRREGDDSDGGATVIVPCGSSAVFVIPDAADPPADVVEAWVIEAISDLPQPVRLRVALVAAELVAGARRTGTAPFVVRLSVGHSVGDSGHGLAVAVDDCTLFDDRSAPDHAGLLVAGLSDRWGVERRAGGRTLWGEIDSDGERISLRLPGRPA